MAASQRRKIETILLAILAIASVVALRFPAESHAWLLGEMAMMLAFILIAETSKMVKLRRSSNSTTASVLIRWLTVDSATIMVAVTPIAIAFLARAFGSPIAFEMSLLTAFGATSLAIAIYTTSRRTRAMSIVISGFLVLFSTSISDDHGHVGFAIIWMTVCVWHLVANHWERLDLCLADSVRPTIGVRPLSVLIAVAVCIAGGLLVRDQFGPSNRPMLGFMPTSGGSKWSDSAARSGIGTGDAAIAAKDHAESFGAVESELFLESTEPTLFDMFNDTIGEPKKKNRWEKRQGMNNGNVIPTHQQAAKTEKGGASFSTDRMPPKQHRHFDDAVESAVVQWHGPTGIRLALERYDTFDGKEWTNAANHADKQLQRHDIDQHVWFFDRKLQSAAFADTDAVTVNLLKVLRLDTTRLPAPMMTAGLHIKDVDRQDFFAIDDDGSLFMPGRDKVPPMTVVNLASLKVMEDELIEGVPRYEDLKVIVNDLRNGYTLDRSLETTTDDPVAEFLRTRRGGDHLFATAAALKARELGLQSRIVTGFYVRPDSLDFAAGHTNITPNDVHVWAEIQLTDGRWFEIEPTPGYRQPVYAPSTWLVAKRFAVQNWMNAIAIVAAIGVAFLTRLIWIESLLGIGWALSWPLGCKQQLRIAMKIVEARGRLTGNRRPAGMPQRDWMESLVASDMHLCNRVRDFCDAADRSIFGGNGAIDRGCLSGVVRGLNTRRMKQVLLGATS